MKTAIFCDFDGTISRRDVGYTMFHHFSNGRNDELMPDWKSGVLSSRDCLLQEAEMINATEDEMRQYLRGFEIQAGFTEFTQQCRESDVELVIVSDGLDLYIDFLFERDSIEGLNVLSNHGRVEGRRLVIEFPHKNHTCPRCGNCKGERIEEYRARNEEPCRVVFIGDGYSDVCATKAADIIFAKKDLEQYCRKNNIAYYGYHDFFDITRQLLAWGYLNQPR